VNPTTFNAIQIAKMALWRMMKGQEPTTAATPSDTRAPVGNSTLAFVARCLRRWALNGAHRCLAHVRSQTATMGGASLLCSTTLRDRVKRKASVVRCPIESDEPEGRWGACGSGRFKGAGEDRTGPQRALVPELGMPMSLAHVLFPDVSEDVRRYCHWGRRLTSGRGRL